MTPETILEVLALEHAPDAQPSATGRKRNLGGAVMLAAIDDYRGTNPAAHRDAGMFLYPQTAEWQAHYDWVVAMAEGVNPGWLRCGLDRMRSEWDRQRRTKLARRGGRSRQ